MGLFDTLVAQAGEALGGVVSGGAQELASPQNLQALAGWLGQAESGGVAGLVQQFAQQGLGDVLSSWMGGGQALPISAEQLAAVFNNDQVKSIAQALGVDLSQVLPLLSQLLPQAVALLSGGGKLPEGASELISQGLSMWGRR